MGPPGSRPAQAGSGWILVAGASRGIGRALAEDLARDHEVEAWSRTQGIDLLDEAALGERAGALLERRGPPFALLHTPGDFLERPLLETSRAEWIHLLESNLLSALSLLAAFVPAMAGSGRGGRVLLFSASRLPASRGGGPRAPAYFAAKAALAAAARALAAETAASSLTVNLLAPGIVLHDHAHPSSARLLSRIPSGRPTSLPEVCAAVRFLLSPEAASLTGAEIPLDGGLGLAAGGGPQG